MKVTKVIGIVNDPAILAISTSVTNGPMKSNNFHIVSTELLGACSLGMYLDHSNVRRSCL